jgi:L,D-peptidoglycan transpeptidase YkuD (ErfK/YbiS/YcfS/YnhG family)
MPESLVLSIVLAAVTSSACPPILQNATRLILVTGPTMNAVAGELRLFKRDKPQLPWRLAQAAEPVVLGLKGMGWGEGFEGLARLGEPIKSEGDDRTPAGVFPVGRPFGFESFRHPGYLQIGLDTVCVDDPSSPAYSTIASRASVGGKTHVEQMGGFSLYRRGLVVDYPSDRLRRSGSCIFIHVWRSQFKGTAGCIALTEPRVVALQHFAEPGSTMIAVAPAAALDRFGACLPPARDSVAK